MRAEEILDAIADAGSWLPVLVAKREFSKRDILVSRLLEAVKTRAGAGNGCNIRISSCHVKDSPQLFPYASFKDIEKCQNALSKER